MKILMTGGTGLIGSAFIRKYSEYEYTVISRRAERMKNKPGSNCQYLMPEYLDSLQNLDDFDAVINLAGEGIADKSWSDERKHVLCQSRWEITQRLADLINAGENPPSVFLSGSAIGIYGRQGEKIVNEEFNDYFEEFSHLICKNWETIAEKANTRVCLLRTGIVLAPKGGALSKMLLPFKLCLGGPMGDGEQYMSWIHIDDEIAAINFLLENEISGPVNLTSPNPATNKVFSKQLCEALHRPMIFSTPAFVLSTLLGEMSDILLFGQNVVPSKLIDAGFKFKYPSLSDAFKAIV